MFDVAERIVMKIVDLINQKLFLHFYIKNHCLQFFSIQNLVF